MHSLQVRHQRCGHTRLLYVLVLDAPRPLLHAHGSAHALSGDSGGDADALFGTNATVQHRANAQADDVGTSPVVSGDPLQRKYVAWAAVLLAAC